MTQGVLKSCCDVAVATVGVVANVFHFGDFNYWNPIIAAFAGLGSIAYFAINIHYTFQAHKKLNKRKKN